MFLKNLGLERIFRFLAVAAGIIALSFALTWPLWSLATGNRRLYTELAGLLLLGAAFYALYARLKRSRKGGRGPRR